MRLGWSNECLLSTYVGFPEITPWLCVFLLGVVGIEAFKFVWDAHLWMHVLKVLCMVEASFFLLKSVVRECSL